MRNGVLYMQELRKGAWEVNIMLFKKKKKKKIIKRRLIETYVVRLGPAAESSRPSKQLVAIEKRGQEDIENNPADYSRG